MAGKHMGKGAGTGMEVAGEDSILAGGQGYFELARAQGIFEVAQEALRISSDYQKQLHEAWGAGIAFKGDELRVQVQTERDQIAVRQSLAQQRIAAARLAQTVHTDPRRGLSP